MKSVVIATWDDAPHLSEAQKTAFFKTIPPYQRDARTKGIPVLGSGRIYPIPEEDIVVADFALPKHFPRAFGLDVGWNRTAAVWLAQDRDSGVGYLYSEHYRAEAEPAVHAQSIRARGAWIPGVIDPAAHARSQDDGTQLLADYRDLGLDLEPAISAVEAGLLECWQLLSDGRLKVFASLANWRQEFRLYHRDDKGRVVKKMDHLMDAMRYLILSGRERLRLPPVKTEREERFIHPRHDSAAWMG